MKAKYISATVCGLAVVLMYNALLIHRDQQLFKAYDQACAAQPSNPNCIYAK